MKNKKYIQLSLVMICLILLTSLGPVIMYTTTGADQQTSLIPNTDISQQRIVGDYLNLNMEAPNVTDPYPPDGAENISINITHLQFTLSDPQGLNMSYTVQTYPDIGSDNASEVSNGTYNVTVSNLIYATTYTWYVNVTNEVNPRAWTNETFTFTTEDDEVEPELSIKITKPEKNSFYFRDNKMNILNPQDKTIIYGPITIVAEVTSDINVSEVIFYIGNREYTPEMESEGIYTLEWKPFLSFIDQTIKVKVTDIEDNIAEDEINVVKWRFHPMLWLAGAAFILNPNTKLVRTPQGYTIIRGFIFNPRMQGKSMTFRAIRLHYTKVGLFQTENGVLVGQRCSINTNSPNIQIAMGPFGMVSWVFIVYRGTSLEQPGLFRILRR
ncbi:MAG: hypothetical protein R6V50_01090 [Thermoplasmatota archaeon]